MSSLEIKLAQTEEDKKQAYRLRYEIFLKELNSVADSLPANGLETDIYDAASDHLLIIDKKKNSVIGTYRILSASKTTPSCGFYAEKMFDIQKIKELNSNIAEVGRSCVHKDYREGPAIALLWRAIASYVQTHNIRYLFGSVRLYTLDPLEISKIFSFVKTNYYAAPELRIFPRKKAVFEALQEELKTPERGDIFFKLPALMKGYLRLGMKVCGPPAWDRHLESVVFLIVLDINNMSPAYKRHFLES